MRLLHTRGVRRCALLVSQQALRPCATTPWVAAVRAAVAWAKENGLRVCTSVGVPTWELQVVAAVRAGVPQTMFVPCTSSAGYEEECRRITAHYGLAAQQAPVDFVAVEPSPGKNTRVAIQLARDEAIVAAADTLVPVCIRPGGTMDRLVANWRRRSKAVCEVFHVPYSRRGVPLKYVMKPEELNPALSEAAGQYIVHWTRGANGPWPTEPMASFYSDVIESCCYPRDAFATLQNIVASGRIVSSSRHMPSRTPCVCFSGLAPTEILPLVRWRARYREMSFEPYGIGVERAVARRVGIERVTYYERSSHVAPPRGQEWCWQSTGSITRWQLEDEYRHRGDFFLDRVPPESIAIFCHTSDEARAVHAEFGLNVVSFT